jgi:serine/threonine protein phosphatase PrpC
MSFKITAASKTDVGQQREQNEDNACSQLAKDGDAGLFIVADGMGGYQAGEVASRIAVDKIREVLQSLLVPISEQPTIKLTPISEQETIVLQSLAPGDEPTVEIRPKSAKGKTRKLPETPEAKSVEDQLKAAIRQANRAILAYGDEHSAARGLGCTVTMAVVKDGYAYIANVGDSRTYLLRDGKLKPVTRDHSLVAKLVETKQIDPDAVYTHPQRNLIYQSLGAGHKNVDPDVFHEKLQTGDKLLLCSDGLWEMVRPPDLLQALTSPEDTQKICDVLIDLANENGGEDNISAVVVQIH